MRSKEERKALHRLAERRSRKDTISKADNSSRIVRDGKKLFQVTTIDGEELYNEVKTSSRAAAGQSTGSGGDTTLNISGGGGRVGAASSHLSLEDVGRDDHHPELHTLASHSDWASTGTGNNVVLSAGPTLTGTAAFADITASGDLDVTGDISCDDLTVGGSASISVDTTATGTVTITKTTTSALKVEDGSNSIALQVDTTNNTVGIGGADSTDTLTVTGTTNITGATTIGGTLGVTGLATLDGGIVVDSDKFTVADGTGDTVIAGSLNVQSVSGVTIDTGNSFELTFSGTNAANIRHSGSSQDIYILPSGLLRLGSGGQNDRIVIASDGHVGIGTPATAADILKISGKRTLTTSADTNYTAHMIANTGSGNASTYYDAIDGDFSGSDYGRVGQSNTGHMEYVIEASSPAPYHVFTGGNVGIGTTSPGEPLDVANLGGGAQMSLTRMDNSISSGNEIGHLFFTMVDADGTTDRDISCGIGAYATETHDGANFGGELRFSTSDNTSSTKTTRMVIDEDGYVGIGTTSPSALLEIASSTANRPIVYITNTSTSPNDEGGNIIFRTGDPDANLTTNDVLGDISFQGQDNSDNAYITGATIRARIDGTPGTDSMPTELAFYTNSGANSHTQQMCILANGNVGIGTAAPQVEFHVESTDPQIRISDPNSWNTTTATAYIEMYDRNDTALLGKVGYLSPTNLDMTIYNALAGDVNFSTSATQRMTILSGGNVGIGIGNPATKLEVLSGTTNQLKLSYNAWGDNCTFGVDTNGYLTITPSGNNILMPDALTNLRSTSYVSGLFTGSGWNIYKDGNDAYNMEVDNLWVRGSMFVWELVINKIRATNGSLVVTSSAECSDGEFVSPGVDPLAEDDLLDLTFSTGKEDADGDNAAIDYHPFKDGDLILAHDSSLGDNGVALTIREIRLEVTDDDIGAVNVCRVKVIAGTTNGTEIANLTGMAFVRVGSTSDSNRRGGVYLTSDDSNAPFIDIWNNVDAFTGSASNDNWVGIGKVKTRLGRLDGITGNTQEYGLMAGDGFTAATDSYLKASNTGVSIYNADLDLYRASTLVAKIGAATPHISIGDFAASTVLPTTSGQQGFWVGHDGSSAYDLLLGKVGGQNVTWDGSAGTLSINGIITVTNTTDFAPITADNTAENETYSTGAEVRASTGWQFTGQTTIDGGAIQADSITAAEIDANTITIDQLATISEINLSGKVNITSTGSQNVMIGKWTANPDQVNVTDNVCLGYEAGGSLGGNTVANNVCIGTYAGTAITTSPKNVAIGYGAGYSILTGSGENVCIGSTAGYNLTSGRGNVCIGDNAGYGDSTSQFTGYSNIAIGQNAYQVGTSGHNNIVLGTLAGDSLTEGHHNVIIGDEAGAFITDGDANLIIGYGNVSNGTGQLSIGIYDGTSKTVYITGECGGVPGAAGNLTFPGSIKLLGGVAINAIRNDFNNDDVSVMTSAAIKTKIESYGYTTHVGDITGVTAGWGLHGGGSDGSVELNVGGGTGIVVNANNIDVKSSQTGIDSITNTNLLIGRDTDNYIDFGVLDNLIVFKVGGNTTIQMKSSGEIEATTFSGSGASLTNVNATTFTCTANNIGTGTVYPVFVDGVTGAQGAETDSGLTYDPADGKLSLHEISCETSNSYAWVAKFKQTNQFGFGLFISGDVDSTAPMLQVSSGTTGGTQRFRVEANGRVIIGDGSPVAALHIADTTDIGLGGGGVFVIGPTNGQNLGMDNNEIMSRNNGSSSTLYLNHDGGDISTNGSVVHSSDKTLKDGIKDLDYGLNEVLQLKPSTFYWKRDSAKTEIIGLIAQDLQEVLPDLVVKDEKYGTLGIKYSQLTPLLIKAVQELSAKVTALEAKI